MAKANATHTALGFLLPLSANVQEIIRQTDKAGLGLLYIGGTLSIRDLLSVMRISRVMTREACNLELANNKDLEEFEILRGAMAATTRIIREEFCLALIERVVRTVRTGENRSFICSHAVIASFLLQADLLSDLLQISTVAGSSDEPIDFDHYLGFNA